MDSLLYFNNPIFVKKSLKFSKNCDFRPVSTNHWFTDPFSPSRRQRIHNYIIFCVDGGRIATSLLKNNSQLPKTDNNIQVKQVRKCGLWLIITYLWSVYNCTKLKNISRHRHEIRIAVTAQFHIQYIGVYSAFNSIKKSFTHVHRLQFW